MDGCSTPKIDNFFDYIDPTLTQPMQTASFELTISGPSDEVPELNLDIWKDDCFTSGVPIHSSTAQRCTSQPAESLGSPSPKTKPLSSPVQRLARASTAAPRSRRLRTEESRRRPPTSTPDISSDEQWQLMLYQDQTTMSIGVLHHLDVLSAQCETLKSFVRKGFGNGSDGRRGGRQMEAMRLQLRNWNQTSVTELAEELKVLPICRSNDRINEIRLETPAEAPISGQRIKDMTHSAMDALLDIYEFHYFPNMFLYEKKALYLRFIGASRALMHRVLD